MNKSDIINNKDALVILNWKQRMESVSGIKCLNLEYILSKDNFNLKELRKAKNEDVWYFKGLVEDIRQLL